MKVLMFLLAVFLWMPTPMDVRAEEDRLFTRTLLRDLETAQRRELIEWAASLNLSTAGSRQDIENRILEYYGVDAREARRSTRTDPTQDVGSVITIERARGSRFFDVEQVNERIVRFSGGVRLILEEEDARHTIEAEEIAINVEQNTLEARGDVTYRIARDRGEESFRGAAISFNIDSWDGAFLRGISETPQEIDGEALNFRVEGQRITRSAQDIIVIDDAIVTSSPADPPNWSIRAGRIWILAPGEWAISNATLRVGRVPMLYFPAFFFPGDRVFFHPVAGTRPREGSFIQTTTYFFGQREDIDPPLSILQLAEGTDEADREIQGLFLRIPDTPGEADPPGWSLKLMADFYTRLGIYSGIDGSLPGLGGIDRFSGRLGIGASRNIYRSGDQFSSFFIDENGIAQRHWNRGYAFGRDVPFRYEAEINVAHRFSTLSISFDALMLSDPAFRRDFGDRSESMDWGFLFSPDPLEREGTGQMTSGYDWTLQASWNPSVRALQPWVQQASINTMRAQLRWRDRAVARDRLPQAVQRSESDRSPEERFLFLQSIIAPELAGRMSGTIFSWERRPGVPRLPEGSPEDRDEESPLRPPWEVEDSVPEPPSEDEFRLPERIGSLPGISTSVANERLALRYSWQPRFRQDRFTDNREWTAAEDVALDWRYSTVQVQNRGQLTLESASRYRLVSLRTSLDIDQRHQELTYTPNEPDEAEERRLRQDAFRGQSLTANQSSSVTILPVEGVAALQGSSLGYTLNSRVYRDVFAGINDDGSQRRDAAWGQWQREDILAHQTRASLLWSLWNARQSLVLTADIPPREPTYTGTLRLVTGPVTSTFAGGARERNEEWQIDPFVQTHVVSLLENDVVLNQRLTWDVEDAELTQSRTALDLWPATLTLTGQRTTGFTLVPQEGWQANDDESFRFTRFTAQIAGERVIYRWFRRYELSLVGQSTVDLDLQRYTSGSMLIDYGFRMKIYRFLDIQLSGRSRNDQIYRYIPALAEDAGVPYRNPVRDVTDSFRIFNTPAREESNFNLESISFSMIHDLQDWELSLRYTGRPELRRGDQDRYQWSGVTVLMVRWRPISELERTLRIEEGVIQFDR